MLQCVSGLSKTAAQLNILVPSVLHTLDEAPDISDVFTLYEEDLPTPECLDMELHMWHRQTKHEVQIDTLAKALKLCDKRVFPNVHTLIKIGATMPATSVWVGSNAYSL